MTLHAFLKRTGMSQMELSRRTGLSQPHINRLTHGGRTPSLQTAALIQKATGGRVRPGDWMKATRKD